MTTANLLPCRIGIIAIDEREIDVTSHMTTRFLHNPKIAPFTNNEHEIRFENRCATYVGFRKKTVLSQPRRSLNVINDTQIPF